ncbi:MAG: glycosyltransferase family 2 protein [Polyangiaceae bacterium]
MTRSRAAIVSTLRSPGSQLTSWVRWHTALGFERFYLFFDADPTERDGALVRSLPGVRVIVVDRRARARMAKDPYCAPLLPLCGAPEAPVGSPEQLTARQLCHVKLALSIARREGMRWLLHIDGDELFHPPARDAAAHFAALDALGLGYVIYDNHEALCETPGVTDPFREVTLFKKNPRCIAPDALAAAEPYFASRGGYFLAYANGKAAVRTVPGAEPAGVHGFHIPFERGLGRARLSSPAILHYPYSGFDGYWRKFQRLGTYSSELLLGRPWYPPLFELASRDLACAGDERGARTLFRRATVLTDRRRIEKWLTTGVLARIREPARLLG